MQLSQPSLLKDIQQPWISHAKRSNCFTKYTHFCHSWTSLRTHSSLEFPLGKAQIATTTTNKQKNFCHSQISLRTHSNPEFPIDKSPVQITTTKYTHNQPKETKKGKEEKKRRKQPLSLLAVPQPACSSVPATRTSLTTSSPSPASQPHLHTWMEETCSWGACSSVSRSTACISQWRISGHHSHACISLNRLYSWLVPLLACAQFGH